MMGVPMDTRIILVLAVLVIMGWFAVGVIYNLRLGDAYLRWLQGGLPRVGERTTMRWLGTSVVDMVIAKARKPFKRLETLIVLAPRDVPWMWALARLRGRRDTLIFRAQMAAVPPLDFELFDPNSWTGRQAQQVSLREGWESQEFRGLQLAAPRQKLGQAAALLTTASPQFDKFAPHYWRISLRKENSQLEIHVPLPDRKTDANRWLEDFQEIARLLAASPATETSEPQKF